MQLFTLSRSGDENNSFPTPTGLFAYRQVVKNAQNTLDCFFTSTKQPIRLQKKILLSNSTLLYKTYYFSEVCKDLRKDKSRSSGFPNLEKCKSSDGRALNELIIHNSNDSGAALKIDMLKFTMENFNAVQKVKESFCTFS